MTGTPNNTRRYSTIVADPPWDYGRDTGRMPVNVGRVTRHTLPMPYPTMTVSAICELPVAELAANDSRLFLWTTNAHLPEAFSVVEAWGFRYRQLLVWEKSRSTPIGSVGPNRAEFILVGRRGSPASGERFPSSVIKASPAAHSRKPDVFMDYIERFSPAPRIELFARRQRLGWDTWGDQALNHVEMTA